MGSTLGSVNTQIWVEGVKMYYIKLSNDILYDRNLTDDELVTYLGIYPVLTTAIYEDTVGISIAILHENMYGCADTSRNKSKSLAKSIRSLLDKEIIHGQNRTSTSFRINKIEECKDKFTIIPYECIIKILRSDYKNKANMIRYFCTVIASRKYGSKISIQPMSYYIKNLGISEKTIINYNECLENMHIIYIRREMSNDGKTNCYGLYIDKEEIDKYADSQGYGKDNHITSNWLRSVCQKYNYYIMHPEKELSMEDVVKFESYNKYCEERQNNDPTWKNKRLNLTKLKGYDNM